MFQNDPLKMELGLKVDPCCAFTLQQKLCTQEENILAKKDSCQEMFEKTCCFKKENRII